MGKDASTDRLLGELSAGMAALREQNDRRDQDFKEFRDKVQVEHAAIKAALEANSEKLSVAHAFVLVLKWLIALAITIAGFGIAYSNGGGVK